MLDLLITPTPGCRYEFIHCRQAKVPNEVLPMTNLKTWCNSTMQLLERAYQLPEFTNMWLKYPKYIDYWARFPIQGEWTIFKYITEV